MFGITDLVTFIIGTTLIVMLPGPNSLYVMSLASRYGIKTGYQGALGVYAGDLFLIVLTALGAASLLHAFPWIFIALKIIGALYLSYLGIKLLIAAFHHLKHPQLAQDLKQTQKNFEQIKPFRTAFTISILNPKAILFYLSFFVQFVDPKYSYPILSFAILAIVLQIISMSYLSLLIFSGAKLSAYFSHRTLLTSICIACVGLLFCGFSFKLAFSTLA